MRSRDILTGFIVLVLLIGGAVLIQNVRKNRSVPAPTPSLEQRVSETFNGLKMPEDGDRVELKDVSGGNSFGVATKEMVLADLPDLKSGESYKVFVDGKLLGSMRIAKGGFLYEGNISGRQIEIRLGERVILEGAF